MAYRFDGTDPFLRASIGALDGWSRNGDPLSGAIMVKRRATGAWHGLHVIDNGSTTDIFFPYEFNPSNQLIGANTVANWPSAATFTNTTSYYIAGFTWNGGAAAGDWVWRWILEGGSWSSESETASTQVGALSATNRHVIGNNAALGDDANEDIVCCGLIRSGLSQATFETLNFASFASWQAVFAGSGAWLLGFEDIGTQLDRTGNGGDEIARSAGITLVSDPAGWKWSTPAVKADYSRFPKYKLRRAA